MTESFLHYVWQSQYFDKKDLVTVNGEPVSVFSPGILNHNAGPDFLHARIRIGDMEWVGSVEIHIKASGWRDHKHDQDRAYDNVILHVVWKSDWSVIRTDGSLLPAIELMKRVNEDLILKYTRLLSNLETIPCSSWYGSVDEIIKHDMMDKTLIQRLELKARAVVDNWHRNNGDWEETLYQIVCGNFGFKVNTEPLQQLARSLPFKIVLKHSENITQMEALLFGQAGFLEYDYPESYYLLLKREYAILDNKYDLRKTRMSVARWRFLRLRPANFPTLRLAQLASLFCDHPRIFSKTLEASRVNELRSIFAVGQSEFWQHHYRFDLRQETQVPKMGTMSIDNIIINTVVPLLVAYGKVTDDQKWTNRAMTFLAGIPAEQNAITRKWEALGESVTTAFDSQALIELYNKFCQKRRCLNCSIGSSLVNPPNR
jgi:Protein of unknown function (DUF2851)